MCGIFGLALGKQVNLSQAQVEAAIADLFRLSESRGREASGIACVSPSMLRVHKDAVPGTRMLRSKTYRARLHASMAEACDSGDVLTAPFATIGHSRLVTSGLQGIPSNNQPIEKAGTALVHNGIVINTDELWSSLPPGSRTSDVDSEVIVAMLNAECSAGATLAEATVTTFNRMFAEASIAVLLADRNALLLATNTGSLYAAVNRAGNALFFASEAFICRELTSGAKALPGFEGGRVIPLGPGGAMIVDLDTIAIHSFRLDEMAVAAPSVVPRLAQHRRIETMESRDAEARSRIRRCTSCILPETMPFIDFDDRGVCNYCRDHKPIRVDGRDALEQNLKAHRSKDKSADCIVAFSGGRDSCYGLHLLKREFGMTPLAYTYDWGMVTDLGRRNQARLCGRLGIEHIWVSADIKAKRANIRRNVEAWLRQPDLGMIPLFMAGDKQFFWYANESIRRTGVDLMVFCDNQYEKTNFKIGFCGIRPYTKTNRPHVIGLLQKSQLAGYYGYNYLRNPAYLNRSIADTLFAFFSYYMIPTGYLPLFQYLPWEEDEVNKVLLSEYDWETAPDTPTTWRIGDGTAPFYNYIYYTAAGFSEFDTFRSMQIRENKITRDQALAMVERENQPRWLAIREYTQMIGVDFDEAMRVINGLPRLYKEI
jgi:hypothetical protein